MSLSTQSDSTTGGAVRLPSVARLSFLSLLVITLTVLSVSLYWLEHHKTRHPTILGDTAGPDHMTVTVDQRPVGAQGRGLAGGRAHP